MRTAKGSFEVTTWDEETYEELGGGAKLTRASVEQTLTGDVDGDGAVQTLMFYRSDGTAHFVGLQHVTGSVGGRKGGFVLESAGEVDGKTATSTWSVVAGSGTAALEGIRGTGKFEAPSGSKGTFELDYELG